MNLPLFSARELNADFCESETISIISPTTHSKSPPIYNRFNSLLKIFLVVKIAKRGLQVMTTQIP